MNLKLILRVKAFVSCPRQLLVFLFVLGFSSSIVIAQGEIIEGLESELMTSGNDTNKVILLNDLCWEYAFVAPEKSIEYGSQGISLAKKLNYDLGLQDAFRYSGRAHSVLGNTEEALEFYKKALTIDIQDVRAVGLIHNDIAGIYESTGDYASALAEYYKALKLFEKIKFYQGIGVVNVNMINIYIFQFDYQKALDLSNEAIELFSAVGDPISEGLGYFNKGASLMQLKEYPEAKEALEKALAIFEEHNADKHRSEAIHSLGMLCQEKGELDKALDLYNQSLVIDDSLGFQLYVAKSYSNIASVHFVKEDFEKAIEYNELALKIAKESGEMRWFMETIWYISESYHHNNQYDLAHQYRLFYDQIKDSLYSNTQSEQIIAITEKYKTEKKDQEIIQLKMNEETSAREVHLYYTIGGISFVALIIGLLLVLFYYRNQKSKSIIVQNELEQKALRSQMNPHFIFNSLNSIQRLYIEGKEDSANDYMADFSNLLRRILDNSSKDKISLKEELHSTQLYLELEKVRTDHLFSYEFNISSEIDQLNSFVPPLILQPYVENAIWHGIVPKNQQGKISIQLLNTGVNELKCIIRDDGIGIAESYRQKKDSTKSSKAMNITADRLGGDSYVEVSELESGGTEIMLRIRKIV